MACHSHENHSHEEKKAASCCHQSSDTPSSCHGGGGIDWLLWSTLAAVAVGYVLHLVGGTGIATLDEYAHATFALMNKMWWGVVLGIFFVGLLGHIPKEFVMKILGRSGSAIGVVRACIAGVLLDLCSHGILLVGMKLYERGASIGQVMAFLIASPWNSLSLTFIMFALMGVWWTVLFIVLSMVIAIASGLIFERLVAGGTLPRNPNITEMPEDFHFFAEAKRQLKAVRWTPALGWSMVRDGALESRMVLRWVFLGVVLAALLRSVVTADQFATYFGATLGGLTLTIIAATIIEVCSEGSTPIAADLLTRAHAPGNSFAFLMTGVSTDYTEIMGLKETTKSWKIALFLPLVTLPQVVGIAWMINLLAG